MGGRSTTPPRPTNYPLLMLRQLLVLTATGMAATASAAVPGSLPNTKHLQWQDDIASRMVAGADRFLLTQIEASVDKRAEFWERDFSSATAYETSLEPNRERLARILGVRQSHRRVEALSLVGTTAQSAVVAETERIRIRAVRWPVVRGIHGAGLLLTPRTRRPIANVVAIADASQTNEWVWKNASTRAPCSYVWTGEYEIFEFDLGSTYNYAEMAALIAPRPFMVERGHFDGVAPDEKVAHEFAKVRRLYAAKLGIPNRSAIEWFVGPHEINGEGTFEFLHQHLDWPAEE